MKPTTSRLASRQFHQWLIPEKTVMGIFSLGVLFIFAGAVLVALAGISSGALAIIGGILLAVGFILLIVCTCLCAHAWCVWYVRDVETQTVQTAVVGTDHVDGDWNLGYGHSEVKVPNGVLRDGRQSSSAAKKHVTISPKSKDIYESGRSNDYLKVGHTGRKSGPSSVTSDTPSTLASLSYLSDPTFATPYSSLNQKRQHQGQGQVQGHSGYSGQSNGYGSVPRQGDFGRTVQVRPYYSDQASMSRQNAFPGRRHSDDDYDNASDMQPMLANQTFPQAPTPQPWQQQPHMSSWQQSHQQRGGLQQQQHQQHHQHQQQQQQQHHIQQQHQQHQQQVQSQQHQQQMPSQQNWRQMNVSFDEPPPPAQPLVYPSARRPMTFEQISSSKVSLYDNIHMNRRDDDE